MTRFLAVLVGALLVRPLFATPDEIRMGSLGARGVVFREPDPGVITEYLSAAGDVNGDGLADFLLLRLDRSADYDGQVHLVYGAPDLPRNPSFDEITARSSVFRRTRALSMGWVEGMAPAGDVDGDGFDDFIIPRPDDAPLDWPLPDVVPGVVYVIYGAARLPAEVLLDEPPVGVRFATLTSNAPYSTRLCTASTRRGDLNGDGTPDLVLGAGWSKTEDSQEAEFPGRVFVLFGGAPLVGENDVDEVGAARPGIVLDGDRSEEGFGRTVQYAGDVNGDGIDDLLIGAPSASGFRIASKAYLFYGARDLPSRISATDMVESGRGVRFEIDGQVSDLGAALEAPGDLNADGLGDILLGAPGAWAQTGEVYLLFGSRTLPKVIQLLDVAETGLGARFMGVSRPPNSPAPVLSRAGESLAVLDHDGDGTNDFYVGSPRFENRGVPDVGRGYFVLGHAFPPGFHSLGEIEKGDLDGGVLTTEISEWLSATAAAPGDVNGDGRPDLLVSAPVRYRGLDTIAPGVDGYWSVYLVYGPGDGPGPIGFDGVSPSSMPLAGGSEVLLLGAGFDSTVTVEIGSRPAPVKRLETTARVVVEAPAGAALGAVDVVIHRGVETRTLKEALRYVPRFYPTIDVGEFSTTHRGVTVRGSTQIETPVLLDWDADGLADLVATEDEGDGLFVVYGRSAPSSEIRLPNPGEEVSIDSGIALLSVGAPGPGRAPSPIGDVNGDGIPDLAIAATGLIRILFGGERAIGLVDTSELVDAGLGADLLVSGQWVPIVVGGSDLDGDGFGDIAATQFEGFSYTGRVWTVRGRKSWPRESFLDDAPLLESRESEEAFGRSVALSGDVDGDGRGDLIVGAPQRFFRDDGHGYVVFGREAMPEGIIEDLFNRGDATRIDSFKAKDSVGRMACALGDFNGDGVPDFALSAEGGGTSFAGESYVIFGGRYLAGRGAASPVDLTHLETASVRITGDRGYDYAFPIAPAGDFNGDGLADIIVSVPGLRSLPHAIVVFGRPAGHVALGELGGDGVRIEGDFSLGYYGAGGGDFNGDGVDDIAVGGVAPNSRSPVFIVFGQATSGVFLRGDSNGDSKLDLSDPVRLLARLFLGSAPLPCDDAADANDDGHLDITDAIYALGHLFLGGPPPPPPFPGRGEDPTNDPLDCRGTP